MTSEALADSSSRATECSGHAGSERQQLVVQVCLPARCGCRAACSSRFTGAHPPRGCCCCCC